MNAKIIGNLFADAVITGGAASVALLSQEGVNTVGDISQAAWLVVGIGALVAMAKGYQTLQADPA